MGTAKGWCASRARALRPAVTRNFSNFPPAQRVLPREDRQLRLRCGRVVGVSEWGCSDHDAPVLFYLHGLPFNRLEPAIYGSRRRHADALAGHADLYGAIRLISVDRYEEM